MSAPLPVRMAGVTRRWGTVPVLRGIDLELAPGERVAVVGPNGAGKTTLLRILAGLLRPCGGEARVGGRPPEDPAVRARVGVLGHAPALYPRLTALENLRFWGSLYGVRGARARGEELLRRLGLDPSDRRGVGTYSQGMRQRVGLARALLHDPGLLLLDEPFAGLDAAGVEAASELIGQDGPTVLLTTHRPELGEVLAHRVVLLEGGVLRGGAP